MAATVIKLSELERQIIDRVYLSPSGFRAVEDLLDDLGVDRELFADALETLEGGGYLALANLGGSLVVGLDTPMDREVERLLKMGLSYSSRVGQC